MTTTTREAITLDFDVQGSGAPLLLLTGLSADRGLWGYTRADLKARFATVALDNRDSGRSGSAEGAYVAADLAQDALAVLDAAGIERAHVLGHSMGGAVAQELALIAPERVDRLILSNSFARNTQHTHEHFALSADLRRGLSNDLTFLKAMYFYGLGRTTLSNLPLSAVAASVLDAGPMQAPEAFLRQIEVLQGVDTLDRLGGVRAPTLVLWSPEDKFFALDEARTLAGAIAGAELVELPGTGHCPMVENPPAFVEAVTRFLS
jgi:pimeloyl-ACP methyl ester carboxylesterase